MLSRVLRVQWYTFFDPPTTVAYKNLILTKYTNIEKCGGEKRKTISVCPRALHCQTKFWLNLKQRIFLSHKWSLLETLVLETKRKLILIFLTNGRFQLKGTPQKKSPPNFSKIGSSDSEGSKIISLKNFWDSRTLGSTRKKLNKVEHGGA